MEFHLRHRIHVQVTVNSFFAKQGKSVWRHVTDGNWPKGSVILYEMTISVVSLSRLLHIGDDQWPNTQHVCFNLEQSWHRTRILRIGYGETLPALQRIKQLWLLRFIDRPATGHERVTNVIICIGGKICSELFFLQENKVQKWSNEETHWSFPQINQKITLIKSLFMQSATLISTGTGGISMSLAFGEWNKALLYKSLLSLDLALTFNFGWNFLMTRSDWHVFISTYTKELRKLWLQLKEHLQNMWRKPISISEPDGSVPTPREHSGQIADSPDV